MCPLGVQDKALAWREKGHGGPPSSPVAAPPTPPNSLHELEQVSAHAAPQGLRPREASDKPRRAVCVCVWLVQWLRHAEPPFDVVIDGPNVGYFGQVGTKWPRRHFRGACQAC